MPWVRGCRIRHGFTACPPLATRGQSSVARLRGISSANDASDLRHPRSNSGSSGSTPQGLLRVVTDLPDQGSPQDESKGWVFPRAGGAEGKIAGLVAWGSDCYPDPDQNQRGMLVATQGAIPRGYAPPAPVRCPALLRPARMSRLGSIVLNRVDGGSSPFTGSNAYSLEPGITHTRTTFGPPFGADLPRCDVLLRQNI